MPVLYENDAKTVLAASILAGATELTVQAGDGALLPNPGADEYFYLTLKEGSTKEVVRCTARSTDTITCDPTSNGFSAGARVELRINKELLNALVAGSSATVSTFEFTATEGQTTFSGLDDNSKTLTYSPGFVLVAVNGSTLLSGDYTASDGATVTLDTLTPAAGASVYILALGTFDVADVYTQAEIDADFVAKSSPVYKGKNAIVDPGFMFWDEGTSFTGLTATQYTATMWKIAVSASGTWSITRVDDPNDNQSYGLRAEVTASDDTVNSSDYALIETRVEGNRYHRLYKQAQTIAVRLKVAVAGTYCFYLRNGGPDKSYVSELTISAEEAGTEVTKYITIEDVPSGGTWDFTTGAGIIAGICLVSSSSYQTTPDAWQSGNYIATANQTNLAATIGNYIELYEVQLEEGPEFTGWERRSYDEELPLVRRYFERITADNSPVKVISITAQYDSTHSQGILRTYNKRAIPSVSFSGATDFEERSGTNPLTVTALTTTAQLDQVRIDTEVSAGMTAGNAGRLIMGSSGFIDVDARL